MDQLDLAAIYERYHQRLYRYCLSILARPEDAQEALQNTMLKALRALPGERREIKLEPWLYRVAHNESIELLRRRHDGVTLESEQIAATAELAETAALRERLRHLFADLGELPERQRGALVMRELAGLEFEQIGEAFGTSAAVARQTVYEARLNLRQLEAGREMNCEQAMQKLSAADGRVARRRDLKAHLRTCADCRAFRDAIEARRGDLAAVSPLPAAAAAGILHGLAGASASTSGGLAGAAGAAGAGAGKAAATSVAVKTVATVAAVATIGVTAADRSGLVDVGVPGGSEPARKRDASPAGPDFKGGEDVKAASGKLSAVRRMKPNHAVGDGRAAVLSNRLAGKAPGSPKGALGPTQSNDPAATADLPGGPPADLPQASQRGQQTAAARKAGESSHAGGRDDRGPAGAGRQPPKGPSNKQSKQPEPKGTPSKGSGGSNQGNGSGGKGNAFGKSAAGAADDQPSKGGPKATSEGIAETSPPNDP
jgi:RNA polymerase sigma factor (sigma-70 family)